MALKPSHGIWQYDAGTDTPEGHRPSRAVGRPRSSGGRQPVQRRFRDGHTETWAATDPATLPDKATWCLAHQPGTPRATPPSQRKG